MSTNLREAYMKRLLREKQPYKDHPIYVMGVAKKGITGAIRVSMLNSEEEPFTCDDGMVLFNIVADINKSNIEIKNLVKYVEVMIEEPDLATPRYLDLFASESLPSVKGIRRSLSNDLLPTENPHAAVENFQRQMEGKTITKAYILSLLKRTPDASFDTYTCTNDVQLAYALLMHCLRLGIRIKKCSECGKLFSMKSNSNRCELCRIENRLSANNKSKERIEYQYYKALFDACMSRKNRTELTNKLRQGYTQYGNPKDKKKAREAFLKKLKFLHDFQEEIGYKPRSAEIKKLIAKVERILREEENNG